MEYLIADLNGKWYSNTGRYGFTDPESKTYFPVGVLVKATETAWLKSQPIFVEVPDPTAAAPAEAQEPAKEPEKKPPEGGDKGKPA